MDTDQLRRGLSAIATEVEPVDLRDRVLDESNRIRTRRAIGATAVAVMIAAIAIPFALRGGHPKEVPAVPTPTVLPTESTDDAPDLGPFDDMTIVVPSWGNTNNSSGCPTGTVKLR